MAGKKKAVRVAEDPALLPLRWRVRWLLPFLLPWLVWVVWSSHGLRLPIEFLPALFSLFGFLDAEGVLRLGLRLLQLGCFWLAFGLIGRAVSRRVREEARGVEGFLLAGALGAGLFSLLLLGLGLCGFWGAAWLKGLLYALGAGGLLERLLARRAADPAAREPWRPGPWEGAALFLILCVACMALLATATPEIFYDSLVYHLALPKLYLLEGRIVPTPHNVYSGIPMGGQMLYGPALAAADEHLCSLLQASFGLAAAAAAWAWGRRRLSPDCGVLAALLFCCAPVAAYAGWFSGVDLAAAFFVAAAMLALPRALPDPEGGAEEERRAGVWAALSGALIGFAMSVKYNVFPIGAVLLVVYALAARRAGLVARMAAACAAVLLPWLAKNVFIFGNPLYPFFNGLLRGVEPLTDWGTFMASSGSRDWARLWSSPGEWADALLLPWKMTNGDWPMGDWPGLALLWLFPLAPAVRWRKPEHRLLAFAALGAYAAWALSSRMVRYLLPALPLLASAVAAAVEGGGLPRWLRRTAWAAALFGSFYNAHIAFRQGEVIGQWKFLSQGQDPQAYLSRQRVTYGFPYYPAMRFIRESLPPRARVLFLGEARGYYCERPFIAATVFDKHPFWEAVRASRDAAELRGRLRDMGVTHIFLSAWELVHQRHVPGMLPRELIESPAFGEFWERHLRRLYEARDDSKENPHWLLVYEILPEPEKDPRRFNLNPMRIILGFLNKVLEPGRY